MLTPGKYHAPSSLRERKKAETRANILAAAHRLFHQTSFNETTIEQICEQVKISKRSFFRYFRDKESLLFPNRAKRLAIFVAFLEKHQEAENPFEILRMASRVFGPEYTEHRANMMAQQALIRTSPALRARQQEIDRDWEKRIALAFSRRSGTGPEDDLWAQVIAGAIMGVVRATMNYWFDRNCEGDLTQIGLDALDCLERGFPLPRS